MRRARGGETKRKAMDPDGIRRLGETWGDDDSNSGDDGRGRLPSFPHDVTQPPQLPRIQPATVQLEAPSTVIFLLHHWPELLTPGPALPYHRTNVLL